MRITRDRMVMGHAQVAAHRATCNKQSVGVAIARDGRVLVTGYNGAPAGMEHCDHRCTCGGPEEVMVNRTNHTSECDWNTPCVNSVHAEANALAYAARYGISTQMAELFTTFSPCLACGQLIVNAGITRVVYRQEHRDRQGLELCESAGIKVVHFSPPDMIA